ncbi:hypothetical protein PN836_015435 [Ningiella sp. W23]|uniref:hypothetical protein n=1 Tax=Ningiella sp. W23 TaxID=3023715 RepID=UPI003756B8F6
MKATTLKHMALALLASIFLTTIPGAADAEESYACFDEKMVVILELIDDVCKKGDIVITASPSLYCDYDSQIIKQNEEGTRFTCRYIGEKRKLREIPSLDDLVDKMHPK